MMVDPSSKIPKVSFVISPTRACRELLTASLPQVPSGLLEGIVQLLEHPVQQPGTVEKPSLVPGPTQILQLLSHFIYATE